MRVSTSLQSFTAFRTATVRVLASPQQLPAIKSAVVHALQTGTLESSARQRLEQVNYLIRSA
jgi:hypothetical protein